VLIEEGVGVFSRLETELAVQLSKKGYTRLADCRGKLKEL
jgi:dihydroorotate dehydrogenase (fumarate)